MPLEPLNLSAKRSWKSAIVFGVIHTLGVFLAVLTLVIVGAYLMLPVDALNDGDRMSRIGEKTGVFTVAVLVPVLTFLILRAKRLANSGYFVLLLLAIPAGAILGVLGMLIPTFLTTREPR